MAVIEIVIKILKTGISFIKCQINLKYFDY